MKAKELKKSYFDWLFQKYSYHDLSDGIVKINTPFLDNQFDYITMYVEFFSDGKINLTDDGWTLHDLKSNGVYFTPRHKTNNQLLRNITDSLGVEINDNELSIKTDIDKFPIAKQRLLQCIMQVNYLIVLKRNNIRGLFFEEVVVHILVCRRRAAVGVYGSVVASGVFDGRLGVAVSAALAGHGREQSAVDVIHFSLCRLVAVKEHVAVARRVSLVFQELVAATTHDGSGEQHAIE